MALSGCGESAADLDRTVRLHVVQQHMAGCRPDVQACRVTCSRGCQAAAICMQSAICRAREPHDELGLCSLAL